MSKKQMKQEKGITLVALVVTIIILLILAGVTLGLALSDTGLFKKAQNAADRYKSEQTKEEGLLTDLEKEMDKYEKGPHGKTLITSVTTTDHNDTIKGEDKLGNPVTVPKNFKVVEGETVEDGIVIEDSNGNQFVWIPVSNTDGDNNADTDSTATDLIKLKDNKKVEITLGRYTFSTSDGTPTPPVQKGSEYTNEATNLTIESKYKENTKDGRPSGCARAKNLAEFVTSVENNHGYYIGRYEASFGGGDTPTGSYGGSSGTTSIMTNQKPLVKLSKYKSDGSMNYTPETLWNFITQEDASKVSQNMYNAEDRDIESDLVNSYAWDTAIVYIQAMGNNNYANTNRDRNMNTELKNTGDTGDMVCNIYDMAENTYEWTTEYSASTGNDTKYPCVSRGGGFYYISSNSCPASRGSCTAIYSSVRIGFRPLLYLK